MRNLQAGDTLGRYRLDRVVGQGGMGTVFAATDQRLGRTVAVKVITGPFASQPEFRDRFHHEATAMSRVDSPHVIQIHDHDEVDGVPFIVTQYVAGTDLATLLRERGPMPARTALQLCAQVARGLADVHGQGVLHRDIKPGNVLVREAGTPQMHAYLCDFGIARAEAAGGPAPTVAGAVTGTWTYLAPERLSGAPATPASDLYALGCVLWACLTGRPPYAGTEVQVALAHAQEPIPRLPGAAPFVDELNAVVARLLAKDPAQRYADAASARADLLRLERAAPPDTLEQAPPPPPPPPGAAGPTAVRHPEAATEVRPKGGGRRWLPVAAAAAAVLLLAGGAVVAWRVTAGDDDPAGGGDDRAAGVAGDLDDDGFGDAAVAVYGDGTFESLLRIPSTGKQLGSPQPSSAESGDPHLGDVDGDGITEVVWVDAPDGSYVISVADAAGSTHEQTIEVDRSSFFVHVDEELADVTGDGRSDLVLAAWTREDGIGLHVAEATDDGFADPEQWWSGSQADVPSLDIVGSGDLDGDGTLELAAVSNIVQLEEGGEDWLELRVVDIGDGELSVGEPTRVEGEWWPAAGVVGDLDADGTSEVLLVNGERWAVGVTTAEDGVFPEPEVISVDDISRADWRKQARKHGTPGTYDSTVSDVDGDGDADLLHLDAGEGTEEIWVQLADEGELAEPVRWGSAPCADPACPGDYLFVR